MKATLEFDLPEEQDWFRDATRASDYRAALDEIRDWLRNRRKYEEDPTVRVRDLEDCWDFFHEATEGLLE